MNMKNYEDAYLLGAPYTLIASGWDSYVFVDGENPDVIIKLYESLTREQLLAYYKLHTLHAQNGVMTDGTIDIEVLDLGEQPENHIMDNEDGVLVILPRINGTNLTQYGTPEERKEILERIQKIAQSHNLPITGWYEIKFENLTVIKSDPSWRLHIVMTDIWARIDECLAV